MNSVGKKRSHRHKEKGGRTLVSKKQESEEIGEGGVISRNKNPVDKDDQNTCEPGKVGISKFATHRVEQRGKGKGRPP